VQGYWFKGRKGRKGRTGEPANRQIAGVNHLKRPTMAKTSLDRPIEELADRTGHKTLATWAADCALRVLPFFEKRLPGDDRPRKAVEATRAWVRTGMFRMANVRRTSLAAHAAARLIEQFHPARSAARAAGQAMASAHVGRHAIAAAIYAATAIRDASDPTKADAAALRERKWQYRRLLGLAEPSRR